MLLRLIASFISFVVVSSFVLVLLVSSENFSLLGVLFVVCSFPLLRAIYGTVSYHGAALQLDKLLPFGTKIQLMEALLCSFVGKIFDNSCFTCGFEDGNVIVIFIDKVISPCAKYCGTLLKTSFLARKSNDIYNLACWMSGDISYSAVCDPWFGDNNTMQLHSQVQIDQNQIQNAFSLSLASKLAYEAPHTVERVAKNWGWNVKLNVDEMQKGTQGFVMTKGENLVLAFRGTEGLNFVDWATDFSISTIPLNPTLLAMTERRIKQAEDSNAEMTSVNGSTIFVHKGFYNALEDSTCKQIYEKIQEHINSKPKGRIWVTGHSLGAALASVFIMKSLRSHKTWINTNFGGLYTFGQPRCGDQNYANLFNELSSRNLVFRIVFGNDLVPRVPIVLKTQRAFVHHGKLIYLTSKFDIERPTNPDEFDRVRLFPGLWENFARLGEKEETFLRKVLRVVLPFSVNDHLPFDYARFLQKALKKQTPAASPTALRTHED